MKSKLRNLLLAAMALTLFAGCSNIALNDAAVEGSDAGDKCVLTISYSDLEGILSESSASANGNARTIDPGVFTDAEKAAFTFKIEGKSARNKTLNLDNNDETVADSITFINGKATLPLDYDVWYLTLHAYNDVGEVLRGVTTVDLKKAVTNNEIEFVLSTKGVVDENGNPVNGGVELTIKGANSSVRSYTSGLYNINDDSLVLSLADENFTYSTAVDATNEITITNSAIPAGTYIFKFIPYNDVKTSTTKEDLTPYSDIITIAPSRTITKTIEITVMEKPEAPTGFKASLVKASEEDFDSYYVVHLEWQDNSTNEENFVLRLYETTTAQISKTWVTDGDTPPAAKKIFDKNFFDDNEYFVDGTLGMSTTECEIKLPTGHLFEMTLTAKNRAGESTVCYRSAPNADTSTNKGFAVEVGESDPKTYVTINRQKITYNLLGGTYTENPSADPVVTLTGNIVKYRTFEKAATKYSLDLIDLSENPTGVATLVYKNHPLSKWTTLPNAGAEITEISSFDDTMVYASYNKNMDVRYSVADKYQTLYASISCSESGATLGAISDDRKTQKLTLDVRNTPAVIGGYLTFNIGGKLKKTETVDNTTDPDHPVTTITYSNEAFSADEKCTEIVILINGVVAGSRADAADVTSYDYYLTNFSESGVYNITVIGKVNGQYYSGTPLALTVDIK